MEPGARPVRKDPKLYYTIALLGLMAAVALARYDLFLGAFHATLNGMRRGGPRAQAHLLFEIVLFAGILLATLRAIPARIEPKRDAAVFLLGAVAGFLAEAWGTRSGLWTYYTRETPPLWIVPVWPLGALVIDRMSETLKARGGRNWPEPVRAAAYWLLAATAAAVFLVFSRPAFAAPATWALFATLAWAFLWRAKPQEDVWIIVTGLFYVFFADLWGTTNYCWRYYHQAGGSALDVLSGVGFGMFFDTAVVLAVLKAASLAGSRLQYRP